MMNKIRKYIVIPAVAGIFFLTLLAFLIGCNSNQLNNYITVLGYTQGTSYRITYNSPDSINYQPDIERILQRFDTSLSTYLPVSIISRINQNDTTVRVDNYFRNVFMKSKEVNDASHGAFDITVGPIVNAWGFGPEDRIAIDSSVIDSLLQYIGMEKVQLKNDKIVKKYPGIKLDVNAIAQGYSADVVAEFLNKKKVKDFMVEIGGEVVANGVNKKGIPWRIGIDKPIEDGNLENRELQAIVQLKNKALATSGNYRKFYEEDGIKYAHSINPKTGYPEKSNLLSVTVLADDGITADAFATAFMIMGLDKSYNIVNSRNDLEAYFIYSDIEGKFKVKYSEGFKKIIVK